MRRQGSQVSMRVARGSASWLSSHGRGHRRRAGLTGPRGLQWTSPCGWWVYLCHLAFPRSPPCTTLSPDTGVMGMNRGGFLLWVLHALSTEWAHCLPESWSFL